jgi:hypothetical protein
MMAGSTGSARSTPIVYGWLRQGADGLAGGTFVQSGAGSGNR